MIFPSLNIQETLGRKSTQNFDNDMMIKPKAPFINYVDTWIAAWPALKIWFKPL